MSARGYRARTALQLFVAMREECHLATGVLETLASGRASLVFSVARKTAKTSRKKPLIRGEAIVRRALKATLHELGDVGYAALKVENVATRARVNKTTIYRRWPTVEALVRAALLSIGQSHERSSVPDTGSVREDLLTVARRIFVLARSPEGRVTMRMLAAESPHSELGRIAESVSKRHDAVSLVILQRARKRGELRANVDIPLLFEVMRAACVQTILQTGGLTAGFVAKLIDLLLSGALAENPSKRRATRPARAAPGARSKSSRKSAARPRSR
jgi:AcrR family transcriptional regulator